MLGAWSAKGEAGDVITLRAALQKKLGADLIYAKGTEILSASEHGFAEAIKAAQQADVAVLALGEDAHDMTGEAASRTELDLPGNQQALLDAIAATGKTRRAPSFQWQAAGAHASIEKGPCHAGGLVSRRGGRACAGAYALW